MSEFKGLEKMELSEFFGADWTKEWGQEYRFDKTILDMVYARTLDQPMEYRNNLLKVIKEEFIPLNNRWRAALNDQCNQAKELCEKYDTPETGVFPVILRDREKFMASLPSRYPELVPMIESQVHAPIMLWDGAEKFVGSRVKGVPTVMFRNNTGLDPVDIAVKSYRAMCARLFNKAALYEQQNQLLARALEENGVQQPPECATIQRQLDELKQPGPEEPAQPDEAGEPQDPCPDANPFALIVPGDGSEFISVYGNKSKLKPYVPEKRPEIMSISQILELLDKLEGYDFSRIFWDAPTEEQAPGYFDVVKQHRDFTTIRHHLHATGGYGPKGPFEDMRRMIDNYCHFFGKGSSEYRNALKFEKKLLKKLKDYGEAGETAKVCELPVSGVCKSIDTPRTISNMIFQAHFEQAPRAVSDNDAPLQQSEADNENDNTFDESDKDTSYLETINNQLAFNYGDDDPDDEDYNDDQFYDDDQDSGEEYHGHVHDNRFNAENEIFDNQDDLSREGSLINDSSVLYGPTEPSAGEENTLDQAFNDYDVAKRYDENVGNATRPPVRHDTQHPVTSFSAQPPSPQLGDSETYEQEEASFFDKYPYINPDSDGFAPPHEATAGEAGDDTTHAGAHASHPPAPFAPMEAQLPVIDLTSPPQRQISQLGSASKKRTHTSDDDQESSDDGAPSVKRRKTDGKTPTHAATTSLGKRSRGDDDSADEEEREQPSKRPRVASEPAQVFVSTLPVAAQAGEPDIEVRRQQIFGSLGVDLEQQQPQPLQYQLLRREDSLPPSPIPEPLTPEAAAADGAGDVPAEMPEPANDGSDPPAQRDPATVPLGHADHGTITVTQLHKLPKYKKKARSKGRGTPNRPWVFPCTFGNDYGLYILGCATKGCDTGGEYFRRNCLFDNEAVFHLDDCCGDFGGSTENMVRKYGKQGM